MSVGVAPEEAQEEVGKIHEENVERLSHLTEGELLEEQDRIRQLLGECVSVCVCECVCVCVRVCMGGGLVSVYYHILCTCKLKDSRYAGEQL